MKKLVVSKILLLSTLPLWMACGQSSVQSELSPVKNNEITFLAKKAKAPEGIKGLVRLKDGEDLNSVTNDIASDEGVKGIVESEKAAAKEEIDAGKRAVNDVAPSAEEIDAGKRAVNSIPLDEGVKGKLALEEGVKGFAELDEGVKGLMKRIQALEEGVKGKQIAFDEGVKGKFAQLEEGVKGFAGQVEELQKKYQGAELDEGVKGKMADLQKMAQEYSNALEEIESIYQEGKGAVNDGEPTAQERRASTRDEGVKGKVALQKNLLIIEGSSSDKKIQELVMVFNGKEKYGIKVNAETLNYGASFELNEKEMKESIFDLVIGDEVITFRIVDGQLQDALKF